MAYKAFNHFINCKVRTKAIEPPLSKINVFNKLINFIKRRLWYKIII